MSQSLRKRGLGGDDCVQCLPGAMRAAELQEPRRGRGGNIRDICCWCDGCQGQSAPPYRPWHQLAGILLGCKHADRVWSWLGGTRVHGSRAPRNAAEPIHPLSSSARAAGTRPTGWVPALISAAAGCCGLSPLLSSAPLKITPTSCDPHPSPSECLHSGAAPPGLLCNCLAKAHTRPKERNCHLWSTLHPLQGALCLCHGLEDEKKMSSWGKDLEEGSGALREMERILEQRETLPALVCRALQELSNVVACCFVPLLRPGKGRRSWCLGPGLKPAQALRQNLGWGQYTARGTRGTSGQPSPASEPWLFTELLHPPLLSSPSCAHVHSAVRDH